MSQPLPLRDQMKALEHLQELDLKIDTLKKKKSALPVAMRAADDAFHKANTAVDAKKNAIVELEKLQRQTEAAMELNRDRVSRANTKLESVQNSQEFQAASKEIEQLKKLNGSLEEQIKKFKTDAENIGKELETLGAQLLKVKGERDQQASLLDGESGQFEKEISVLMGERKQYVSQVEARILSQYDRIRGARGGLGLVPAVGGRCSGCNMMVPPQLYNEVQRANQVQMCPSCNRILFIPGASQAGPANPAANSMSQ